MKRRRDQLPLFPSEPRIQEYRADGWPLCPQCGEDELFPIGLEFTNAKGQTWREHVETLMRSNPTMRCYLCQFEGQLGMRNL